MSLAHECAAGVIAAVRAAGGTIRRDGDTIELVAPAPLPAALVVRIRAAKAALLAALDAPADWHARHREALHYWGVLHPPAEAAALAWGELQNCWHKLHGKRFPAWQCAGCGEAIGGFRVLDLSDGNRVHSATLNCLVRYGQHWRNEATRALAALGLPAPAEGARCDAKSFCL
jgi:hypothetical protein